MQVARFERFAGGVRFERIVEMCAKVKSPTRKTGGWAARPERPKRKAIKLGLGGGLIDGGGAGGGPGTPPPRPGGGRKGSPAPCSGWRGADGRWARLEGSG